MVVARYTGCLVTVAKEMKIELGATSHMIYNSKIYKFVEFHDGAISITIVTIFRTSHTDYYVCYNLKCSKPPSQFLNKKENNFSHYIMSLAFIF